MLLSIVIPCYNEEKNIPLLIERISKVVRRNDIEFILIDNGSTDQSARILTANLKNRAGIKMVRVEKNQGYGYGILAGLSAAKGKYLGWTHADLQTDPADCMQAVPIIEQNASSQDLFIKGRRSGRPLFDQIFTWGMSIFETVLLGTRLWDINAQPTIFSREQYKRWKTPPHDFSLDLYAYYFARKFQCPIRRIPVRFPERLHGTSSWNHGLRSKWKFIKRTMKFSLQLKKTI